MPGSPPTPARPVRAPRAPLGGRDPPSSARAEPEPAPVHLRHQGRIGAGSDRTSPSKPPGAGSQGRSNRETDASHAAPNVSRLLRSRLRLREGNHIELPTILSRG